ncbi:MAG: hypothetical protein E7513_01705 [Ruminococcaceae bacterium]|nr:hypothetical protein [Oscillospiraceae bacterium]
MFKKLFSKKNNLIISIVALVECIILLGISTYSWIESASSLVIKGNDLPIAKSINYRFDVKDGATNMVDLSTYFRPTALYQFAKASSPDAKNFYFKKSNATTYRLGDTTDFNTSYYNIDFQIHNKTSKSFNYYFDKADIFDVTSDKITDESVLKAAEGAFRISVTAGTNTTNTRIYSRDTVSYNAINSVGATSSKQVTTYGLSGNSQYNYQNNPSADYNVFSTTGGGDDTKVNVKIWFEEKDPGFVALTADEKTALLGATVSINLKFVNAASNFQTFFFDDYTFSTLDGFEGAHVTSEDQTKKMYFYYSDGSTTSVVPMTTTTSSNDATRWVTATDEGDPTPRIPDDMRQDLEKNPSHGYFFYGTLDSSGKPVVTYQWNIEKPAVNDGDVYIFKAMSVNTVGSSKYVGYGVWDNVPIKLWYFKDLTTSATDEAYNANGAQFVNSAGQGSLYINNDGAYKTASTKMYYDSSSDTWLGYYLNDVATPYFMYLKSDVFSASNIAVKWTASNPTEHDGETIYKALGYEASGLVDSQSSASGVGTWGIVEKISFSTELVDASMNKDFRYKVGTDVNGTRRYYYMSKDNNDLHWFAYVPQDSGTTTTNYLQFQRFGSYSATSTVAGTWNNSKAVRNGSNIYYATDMAATTSNGQWHIGVVVDGSADNIIRDTLETVDGSKLEYSIDGGETFVEMNPLDKYRWYTNDFDSAVTNITYRWTAYPDVPGFNEAVFTYGHDLANGIYFNITE